MARFTSNRRWTFILALGICLACCSVSLRSGAEFGGPADAHAAAIKDGGEIGDVGGIGGGGENGDPDIPDGRGKSRPLGMTAQSGTHLEARAAGDSRSSIGAGLWRLRVALESLRGIYFRF